jgi:hypothetical protein
MANGCRPPEGGAPHSEVALLMSIEIKQEPLKYAMHPFLVADDFPKSIHARTFVRYKTIIKQFANIEQQTILVSISVQLYRPKIAAPKSQVLYATKAMVRFTGLPTKSVVKADCLGQTTHATLEDSIVQHVVAQFVELTYSAGTL